MDVDRLKLKFNKLSKFILKRDWLTAIIVTISIVFIGSLIGIESAKTSVLNPTTIASYRSEPGNRLSFFANWDGVDYINIAKNGYSSYRPTNFFPTYPILLSFVNKLIVSPLISGLIVSWVFLAGAIFYYLKITRILFKEKGIESIRAVLLFVLFPTAFYLTTVYTESLFAFLALGAIYYAIQKRYLIAGLLSALATSTHLNGVFLLILIGLILLEEKEKLKNIFITLVIGSLGLVSYMLYLWAKFKNPFEFITAQHQHGWLRHSLLSQITTIPKLSILCVILIILAAVYWWRKRLSFSIYSLSYLLIPILGGQFGGFPRYTLMIFPIPFMFYDIFKKNKLGYELVLVLSSIVWIYLLLQFAAGYIIN